MFLRHLPRESVATLDHRLAPAFALVTVGIVGVGIACAWLAYQLKFVL